jgi:hypothetical protein
MINVAIVPTKEDAEMPLHAPQTKSETSVCVHGQIVIFKNCIIVRKQLLDYSMYLAT